MDINNAQRQNVIDSQVRPWGGLNYIANNALRETPREFFVPEKYTKMAFADIEIPLTESSKMLSPKVEGRLLSVLDIKPHESLLEIGTGSGYLTAVMSKLANSVTSIEIDPELSKSASEKLSQLNISNVKLEVGDASNGWDSTEFYDVVVVGASVPKITGRYFHLLNVGGRIFVIEGKGKVMSAKLITRIDETNWKTKSLFETQIQTMIGLEESSQFEF
ncbi:protein-L-isoaspartate O-methyltransferase [Gammaproteobacteria bacterium]|nr:protein-L-isoaspartate O-methyltransferase [Gammaproteobacteria bacterium]